MPVEWALGIVDLIIKRKGDIRNCNHYSAVKLLWNEVGRKGVRKSGLIE